MGEKHWPMFVRENTKLPAFRYIPRALIFLKTHYNKKKYFSRHDSIIVLRGIVTFITLLLQISSIARLAKKNRPPISPPWRSKSMPEH